MTSIDNGWRLKPIHKLIVTSAVYMQDSRFDEARARIDRENVFLWRHTPRRLEAEPIRDAMLAVSGRLDPRMYGPGTLDPRCRGGASTSSSSGASSSRSMMLFDWPEHLVSIGQRSTDHDRAAGAAMLNSALGRGIAPRASRRGSPAGEIRADGDRAGLPDRLRPRADRAEATAGPSFPGVASARPTRASEPARARSIGRSSISARR